MALSPLLIALPPLFFLLCTVATAYHLAEPVAQPLEPRLAFLGGYTLAMGPDQCPIGTNDCGSISDSNEYACCPSEYTCFNTGYTYCCPDPKTDCGSDLSSIAVCADPSWGLWSDPNEHGPFCCEQDQVAVADPSKPFGQCFSAGTQVASDLLASTITQAFAAATSTGSSSGFSSGSSPGSDSGSDSGSESSSGHHSIAGVTKNGAAHKRTIIGVVVGCVVGVSLILAAIGHLCRKCFCGGRKKGKDGKNKEERVIYEPYRGVQTPGA